MRQKQVFADLRTGFCGHLLFPLFILTTRPCREIQFLPPVKMELIENETNSDRRQGNGYLFGQGCLVIVTGQVEIVKKL